jgi:diacylglycerol kinase (ATP)
MKSTNVQTRNWGFILNPTAGNYFGQKYEDKLREVIKKKNLDADISITNYKGHATQLAEEYYNKGYNNIVAVGGDGTINEVASFLINKPNVKMGIVPAGTGNDTIQILGFPNRFDENDWDVFLEANSTKIDTGLCNGKAFLNGMGIGFDAQVAAQNYTEDGSVKREGGDKYLWHILKTLWSYKENNFKIKNGQVHSECEYFMSTIANGRRFAAKYFITPEAYSDDGMLDICLVKKIGLLRRFRLFMQVPTGSHINDKNVEYFKTDEIKIEFDKSVPYHLDGELFYDSVFNVSIQSNSLDIIYNPQGSHYLSV